jgi:tRNA dimethylallyltransferase
MGTEKTLIVLVGASASGKTSAAIELARHFKTEIISADSRQFYREISIGTAKPSKEELQAIPHHFINNKSIHETYSAGDFEPDAISKINELFTGHQFVVMVGGSGLYIDAVCKGMDNLPTVGEGVRAKVIAAYQKNGIAFLRRELSTRDPEYYSKVDIHNPQRLMRALEVIYETGATFSSFLRGSSPVRDFKIITIGLHWERDKLYQRINQRVDGMIRDGLEEEAARFAAYRDRYALRSVGYTEFFDYFDGKQDKKMTCERIKQHTRNFAKRQITWFKRNTTTYWVDAGDEKSIFAAIDILT